MSEYEFCMICAEKYRVLGNMRMYKKYVRHAMHISKKGWENDSKK